MKTLTINTSALEFPIPGSRISQGQQIHKLNTLRKPLPQLTQNTAWLAFQSGMKALYRYGDRSRADSAEIVKINLQLLHQTLLVDSSYRERINANRREAIKNGLPTVDSLLAVNGFTADLVTIQPGYRTEIISCDHYNRIYMLLSGKLLIVHGNDPSVDANRYPHRMAWWKRLKNITKNNIYGKGSVIIPREDIQGGESLNALKRHCVLLRIKLSIEGHIYNHSHLQTSLNNE